MPSQKRSNRRDLITFGLDVIVVAVLYHVAVASDPVAELKWIGMVLGIGTIAAVVLGTIIVTSLTLGSWLLLDSGRRAGGFRRLPVSMRVVYATSLVVVILSIVVLSSTSLRFTRMLVQTVVHAS
jgi:hypothetical protein